MSPFDLKIKCDYLKKEKKFLLWWFKTCPVCRLGGWRLGYSHVLQSTVKCQACQAIFLL